MSVHFREARSEDLDLLAGMNQALIRDEGHGNSMMLPELRERMAGWLAGEYKVFIFSEDEADVGYALYRYDPEWVYLRQFYIQPEKRRRGLGLKALEWLKRNPWKRCSRIRLDVLINNESGIAFWHAAGFKDYCITMEMGSVVQSGEVARNNSLK